MKIVVPKPSRGWHFPRLLTVELNDFDVERLLPSLYYLVVTRGKKRGPRVNDAKQISVYLERLLEHKRLDGFDDQIGRRMLDRWVRSAILQIGRVGLGGKKGEQIESILPFTLLAYKTGFPTEIRRQRNAHVFLYQLLRLATGEKTDVAAAARLDALFRESFARGIKIDAAPTYDGRYDGSSVVDVHTLLSLCYLDGFQASSHGVAENFGDIGPALPPIAESLARDVLAYLLAYKRRLPVLSLTRGLMTLINFTFFVYTCKLTLATNRLVATGELTPAMTTADVATPPELYADFTRERSSPSDDLARACVDRDLEEIRQYVDSLFLLRTVDRFVQFQNDLKLGLQGLATPEYLSRLVSLRQDPRIEARAQAEIESIQHETYQAAQNDAEKAEAEQVFAAFSHGQRAIDAVVALLSESQRQKATSGAVMWFWSVGGLRKPYGILTGNVTGRRNWRYCMSDDLLTTLVQVAMVEDPTCDLKSVGVRPVLKLSDFLRFLETRYGLIVNRPPSFLDGATGRAAAAKNLEALKRRLRQMGFFQALSDDFTAQYLQMPEMQEVV